jgi:hypothetical protein
MYPRWSDGKELFFVSLDRTMMAVGFDATNGVPEGVPRALFPTQIRTVSSRPYAVAKNGDRFLIPIFADLPLRANTDWRALLKAVNCAEHAFRRTRSDLDVPAR